MCTYPFRINQQQPLGHSSCKIVRFYKLAFIYWFLLIFVPFYRHSCWLVSSSFACEVYCIQSNYIEFSNNFPFYLI